LITIPLVTCLFQGRPNESCWWRQSWVKSIKMI
jgi:hypothetical protein